MPLRVLVAPDKFKGTLTAEAAAAAIADGWRRGRPDDRLETLPISDGGDGFGEILSGLLEARPESVETVDAAHRPCRASWWWEPRSRTAIVESAKVIGLAQLPPGRYHPFELDTFGLGKVLLTAAEKGAQRCIVGIGGSATNDGGTGLARALGWRFLDPADQPIESWPDLRRLARLVMPARERLFPSLTVAVDVRNRLLGPKGCSRIYGPQKGLRPEDIPVAEAALNQLRKTARAHLYVDKSYDPGSGAAGGLGYGLMTFAGAEMEGGFGLFAELAGLKTKVRNVDLVITGEGLIDASTLMGKGVGELARLCRRACVPCIGLGGAIGDPDRLRRPFAIAAGLVDLAPPAQAKKRAAYWLEKLAAQVAGQYERTKTRNG